MLRIQNKMAKINNKEIGLLVFVILLAFVISMFFKNSIYEPTVKEEPSFVIYEGASDDYIQENAYKNADDVACEYIEDEAEKAHCFELVKDREFLDEGVKEVRVAMPNASSSDLKLLGKAMLANDASMCEEIVDAVTKQRCLDSTN